MASNHHRLAVQPHVFAKNHPQTYCPVCNSFSSTTGVVPCPCCGSTSVEVVHDKHRLKKIMIETGAFDRIPVETLNNIVGHTLVPPTVAYLQSKNP